MDNAIFLLASKRAGLTPALNSVASNVANSNTDGFRGSLVTASEHLVTTRTGEQLTFPAEVRSYTDTKQGAMRPTGRMLDVAISGEGFFKVDTPNGVRYTRMGNFTINQMGEVVTAQGYKVLMEGNTPFTLTEDDTQVQINEDGTIFGGEDGTLQIGRLAVVGFDNEQLLKRLAGGLFQAFEREKPLVEVRDYSVAQRFLEGSNVNPVEELSHLIEIQRETVMMERTMQRLDRLQTQAISAISGLRQ